MSRQYPSFIYMYSDLKDREGHYITHTVYPRLFGRIIYENNFASFLILDIYEDQVKPELLDKIKKKAVYWFINNIRDKIPSNTDLGVSIHKAFIMAMSEKNIAKLLGLKSNTVSTIRSNIAEKQKFPSIDTMQSYLKMLGWDRLQEELWVKL